MKQRAMVTMREPVHGDIELTREEIALIDTPEFQRLRGVKQLGTAYLIFPGATHTRFEHSIGVLHMTDKMIDGIQKHAVFDPHGCRAVGDEERRILRIAALLHDVTHIPFGHNIEDQTGLLPRHDRPERFLAMLGDSTELGRTLKRIGIQDEVLGVLCGDDEETPSFWKQLLSDTIDADLLDYLKRDAYYTGLDLHYDNRVLGYFKVDKPSERLYVDCEKEGMLRESIMSELLRVLEARYHFSERVYYHHAKVAAGALLARMVELALRSGAITALDLQHATDESLIAMLERADLGDARWSEKMGRFVARFRRRSLPKRVLVLPFYLNESNQDELIATYFEPGNPNRRFAWEAELESQARSAFGKDLDVIMYCPARAMQLKEARTLVNLPGSGARIVPLSDFAALVPRLRDLQDSYPRLWKLYVFCSEEDRPLRRRLQEMCLDALPAGCVNALRI